MDLVWAVAAGLIVGALSGAGFARLAIHFRAKRQEGIGPDEFIALGLIAFSYCAALLLQAYGFLAVFAAGLTLRQMERRHSNCVHDLELPELAQVASREEAATDSRYAPAYMAQAVLGSAERAERLLEVGLVLLIGVMLVGSDWEPRLFWFAPLLFLVLRPAAVFLGCIGVPFLGAERNYLAWFGIRGIGSLYYLMFAVTHGLP